MTNQLWLVWTCRQTQPVAQCSKRYLTWRNLWLAWITIKQISHLGQFSPNLRPWHCSQNHILEWLRLSNFHISHVYHGCYDDMHNEWDNEKNENNPHIPDCLNFYSVLVIDYFLFSLRQLKSAKVETLYAKIENFNLKVTPHLSVVLIVKKTFQLFLAVYPFAVVH